MKRYFIETSSIIDYLREKEKAVNQIERLDGEITSGYICLAELYEGIYRVKDPARAENGIITFFEGLSEIFGIDYEISKMFGMIRCDLKKQGSIIEDIDILIAATCIVNNLILMTENTKHFEHIKDLKILR